MVYQIGQKCKCFPVYNSEYYVYIFFESPASGNDFGRIENAGGFLGIFSTGEEMRIVAKVGSAGKGVGDETNWNCGFGIKLGTNEYYVGRA